MVEIPKIEAYKSSLTVDQMLEYLKDIQVDVKLSPTPVMEVSPASVSVVNAPPFIVRISSRTGKRPFEPEIIPLPRNWNQLCKGVLDYRTLNYTLHILPSDCPKRCETLPVEDSFGWEKREQSFTAYELGIGLYPHCLSYCRKYLDPTTSCGQYAAVKVRHVVAPQSVFYETFHSSLVMKQFLENKGLKIDHQK
jgi:hypothetical protein